MKFLMTFYSSLIWNFHDVILVAASVGIKWDDLQPGSGCKRHYSFYLCTHLLTYLVIYKYSSLNQKGEETTT
jgi:hypothetical protein